MKHLVALWIGLMSFVSCSRKVYIPIENTHTDTLFQLQMRTDSVIVRDSVYFEYKTHGDTVYMTKHSIKWRDRWHYRLDTIYKSKIHTITKIKTVEVEKEATIVDKIRNVSLSVCLLGLLAICLLHVAEKVRKK